MTAARTVRVLRALYVDSVRLLRISESLAGLPGVVSGSAVMATPMNLDLLSDSGFDVGDVSPDDLVVAVEADDDESASAAIGRLDELFAGGTGTAQDAAVGPKTLRNALASPDRVDVVVIAVPGEYAALEAWEALRAGCDVFIFSDNVPLEDEVALKRFASRNGLLVMGPDCGTAIIRGFGIGFANRVQPGSVGLVGASGTGLQQVSSLLHASRLGLAVAYGTGSHDLSREVGGVSTLTALERLVADPAVESIGLISKPADPDVAELVLDRLASCGKPAVACLLGHPASRADVAMADDLTDAANRLAGGECFPSRAALKDSGTLVDSRDAIAGLFAGGTLCEEAKRILLAAGLSDEGFVDVGGDEFTRGRAHPMIDSRLRAAMIADTGATSDVLLFDVVLGDMAHQDPAGSLVPALREAQAHAAARGRELRLFASLIGTDLDPQGLDRQRDLLEAERVTVSPSNAHAARLAVAASLGGAS